MPTYDFKYTVNLDDLDYMQIVGNADWLILFERARIELCGLVGYPFSRMMEEGVGGVVAEVQAKYYMPAYYNDRILISITPHFLFEKGFSLKCKARNQNDKLCVVADFKMVFVNSEKKPISVPEPFLKSFFADTDELID